MKDNTIVIEKGCYKDLDELEILYNRLNDFLSETINYPGWIKGIYPVRETAVKAIREENLFVLRKNGVIAGSIILNHVPEEAYKEVQWEIKADYCDILVVRTLVVHPEYMKQGFGLLLMEFAREYAITSGMKALRLDVSKDNASAIRLYEKCGYKYIATVDLGLPYAHLKWFLLYEMILT